MLSTVVIINILYARAINNDEAGAYKGTHNHDRQILNAFFMSTNYCLVMSSACNTIVFVKSFETTIYTPKTEVG